MNMHRPPFQTDSCGLLVHFYISPMNWTEWTDIKWSLVCFKTIVWVFRWV